MTQPSIFLPTQPVDPAVLRIFVREAFAADARRLWTGQTLGIETHDVAAYLSGLGYGMPFASGVQLMGLRHPFKAAVDARSTAIVSGHEYLLGLGSGSLAFRRSLGMGTARPVSDARDYVTSVRAVLRAGAGAGPTGDKMADVIPRFPSPPVRVGLGVLGPRMAEAAGAVADAAITWLAPRSYIADALIPAMTASSGSARPTVTAVVHCAVRRPGIDAERTVTSVVGAHLSGAHYQRMLRRAGLPIDTTDVSANARTLLAENVFVVGSPEDIADEIAAYTDAGVDEVAVNVGGVFLTRGASAAIDDMREIFAAVASRSARVPA